MRFVPFNCIRPGMILGKTLWGLRNEVLLTHGTVLNESYVESLRRLQLNGIYIEDSISGDVEIASLISDTLRSETVKSVKNLFVLSEKTGSAPPLDAIRQQIGSIVEDILDNRNLMINMIDLKVFDNYTYAHSVNVAVLSIVLGLAAGMNRDALNRLGMAALMHDIGKVFTPIDLLNKPGRLSEEEFSELKRHSERGFEYVKTHYSEFPVTAYVAILEHHERYDGTGYPLGKAGTKITTFGSIIAIADVYDALTSDRPYRKALPPSEAIEYFMASGGSHFHPDLLALFIRKVAPYPVGTCVTLSNGWIGLVLENYESFSLRPKLRIFRNGDADIEPFVVNLRDQYEHMNLTVTGIAEF